MNNKLLNSNNECQEALQQSYIIVQT